VTARAILALPGWFVTMKVNSELKALNAKQVPRFVMNEPEVLGDAMIQRPEQHWARISFSGEFNTALVTTTDPQRNCA
jgi:hypothetical protein